jgi:hypothetical protein
MPREYCAAAANDNPLHQIFMTIRTDGAARRIYQPAFIRREFDETNFLFFISCAPR